MGNIHSDSGVGESLINHDEQYKDESHPSSVIIENRDGWNSIKHQEKVTSVSLLCCLWYLLESTAFLHD